MRARWLRALLITSAVVSGWAFAQAPTSLALTLTDALERQGLPPSALSQPSADHPGATPLFQRFMTAPTLAWAEVDQLARWSAARMRPSEVLHAMRQHIGSAPATSNQPPASTPPRLPTALDGVTVPAHIPQPLAGELQRALNTLTEAEGWRQHALRHLPSSVSVAALVASALPSTNAAADDGADTSPHAWPKLGPLVDQHALHTGAQMALAAAERLHHFVTQSPALPPVQWRMDTPAGTVLVDTTGAHNHHLVEHPLLLLDVGGDDRHEVGSAHAAASPGIRLLLDHGGNDRYQSRAPGTGASSAVLGYGILWDTLGDDQHQGGWLTQGAALFGVALHIDDNGHNLLQATGLAQGFAIGGTALLLGSPGDDRYRAQTLAQASAGPYGQALLLDPAGNDHYHLGSEVLLWPSPQLPERNVSLGQGAAFGLTGSADEPAALPGGWALLLDAKGHDHYQASVFAQGAGLRQGTGLLLDQAGHNHFRAAWYAMGAAAHQGVGLLWASGEGDDRYEVSHVTSMGAGHDEAVGMLVDTGGHDQFVLQDLGLGAGHSSGHGVLVRGLGASSQPDLGSGSYRFTGTPCRGMGQNHDTAAAPTGPGQSLWVDTHAQRYCHGDTLARTPP